MRTSPPLPARPENHKSGVEPIRGEYVRRCGEISAKSEKLEVELSISREETKAATADRDQAKAAARKSETELAQVSERLARQSNALEQAHGEADQMAARISALENEVANEQRRNKEQQQQAARAQAEMGELKARAADVAEFAGPAHTLNAKKPGGFVHALNLPFAKRKASTRPDRSVLPDER